jgi:hypothetical protein
VRYEQAVKSGDAASGDLGGTFPNPTVAKLRGTPLSANAPTSGQILAFDGTQWAPVAPAAASGTSTNTPNTLVQRDAGGGFEASALTLSGKLDQTSVNGFVARGTLFSGSIPASGAGTRLMWYPGKAAFRAGEVTSGFWDDGVLGRYSVAFGLDVSATNSASIALGQTTTAQGARAFAAGLNSIASGSESFAMGNHAQATAFGSIALGLETVASGFNSTALGSFASTGGQEGSFVYGDRSTTPLTNDVVTASRPNEFVVRAAGGFRFRTNMDLSTGCDLSPGSGSWSCSSSRYLKTNFTPVDGNDLLHRIAGVPVTTWRYRTEDPAVLHLGPMAQDFRAAFGLGTNDTSIGLLDLGGVTFAGVQALAKQNAELRAEITALKAERSEIERRLSALEAAQKK